MHDFRCVATLFSRKVKLLFKPIHKSANLNLTY